MKPKEHLFKDAILKCLIDTPKTNSISAISKHLNIDYYSACYAVDDLINMQLVDYTDIAVNLFVEEAEEFDKSLVINHRGRFFLKEAGGYTALYKKEKWKTRGSQALISLSILSTTAISVLTYLNYEATNKSNDNKEEVQTLNSTIHKQQTTIDSLQNSYAKPQ